MSEIHPLLKSKGNKPRTGKVKYCEQCGKEVYRSPSEVSKKYCSFKCYNSVVQENKKTRKLTCKMCKKEFTVYPSEADRSKYNRTNRKFCSTKCDKEYKKRQSAKPEARSKKRQMRSGRMRSLDNLFSKIIRTRDGKCLYCGTTENLQCSHVLPRTYLSVRWNLDNAITLCYKHHIYWWHKYPHDAVKWFDDLFPNRYQEILDIALKHEKINRDEKFEELKKLAKQLDIK